MLLDNLDRDDDNALTPADVATFVLSLTRRAPPTPPMPKPPPQAISPPFPPHAPGSTGTGEIMLPPNFPVSSAPLASAEVALTPGEGGASAGSVFGVLALIGSSIALIALIAYLYRGWRRKRAPDRRRMLGADTSTTGGAGVGTPGFATDYAAPLPVPTPLNSTPGSGQCWGAVESGSVAPATHNTDALTRARAANASASNGASRV